MGSVNRRKHVHHAPALRARWGARGAAALLVLAVGASATITASASAQDPGDVEGDPQRVLQSVSVGIAPDGAITAIDSTSVSKTDSSELSSDEESFDPADVAGELPVRILTSYRLGDRAGTDLSEIAGESGRVVVEVVVQNTTVRPQELTYDVGSAQRSQFALVGAPLTVVATAGLGDSGLTRVVTDDGVSDSSDSVTNGVLSRTEDDDVQVQWASLLAPPRLSPSATFRLVQETDSFEVPTFDINVQPGLVTDTSVQRLVESAFSDDSGSTMQLENRTIALIGQVTSALEVASGGLSDIEQLLDTSARTIGQRTIADLTSSSDRITTELTDLAGQLESLNADIDSQLTSTQSSTLDQLARSVSAIKSRLGDPAATPAPAPIRVDGCSFDFSSRVFAPGATVFEQLLQVRTQLTAIGDASRRCATELADDLRAAIGSTDDDFVCEPGSQALICALGATKDSITEKAVDLSTVGTTVAGRFEEARLLDLRASVDEINDTVAELGGAAEDLTSGETAVGPLVERLRALMDGLTSLQIALQPGSGGGIPEQLGAINSQANTALTALGGGAIASQAAEAASAACAIPILPEVDLPEVPLPGEDDGGGDGSAPAEGDGEGGEAGDGEAGDGETGGDEGEDGPDARDAVSLLLTGVDCSGGGDGSGSVAARASAAESAISEVARLSDLDDPANPVNQQLAGLRSAVGNLLSLGVSLATSDAPGLRARVEALAGELTSLGAGIDDLPSGTTCPTDATTAEDELTSLNRSFLRLYCKQAGLESFITEQFAEAGGVLGDVQDDLTGGQESANAARLAARGAVDDTTAQLSRRLQKAGDALRTRGARQIAEQRQRLDAEVADVTRLLDDNISSAIALIDSRVRTANGNLDESQRRLVSDLARVLTDIGTGQAGGTGLLGALASGAAETRTSNQSILQVSETAGAFRNQRSAAMEDTLLQQAQLRRSLELLQELPVFGLSLPEGSRHVSVFSYHLGEG